MTVHEQISVITVHNKNGKTLPWRIQWRGRTYQISKVDFHHLIREDTTLFHIYGVTDGNSFFRLKLDTTTLLWSLEEISSGVYL